MTRIPLRLRLTIVFAGATAIVLLLAGWLVYARVGSDLDRNLDQDLRARGQDLSALVRHGGSLRATTGSLVEQGESFAELIRADGRVLDSTRPIGVTRLLTGPEIRRARERPLFVNRPSVPGLDEPARLLAIPLERRGRRLVLVAGATHENRAETLHTLLVAFLIGGPVVLLLMAAGGYLLAGAALRPIEAMRRRADEISAASLDERLPVTPARDEVAALGRTLNEMLARVEDGLERERRFVADASHELRTPLSLLKTELELALRQDRSPEELQAAIRSAASEADRLARLADDLLLLARAGRGSLPLRLEPTDAGSVVETIAARFASRADAEGHTLAADADGVTVVLSDRLRLEQALGNMVDNALRYGAHTVRVSVVVDDGTVEFHVLDDGPGFPEAFLPRAFERFSRGDESRSRDGSGLGLAIVDTVARAHEGSAHAANRAEGGADVWIALPRSSESREPAT